MNSLKLSLNHNRYEKFKNFFRLFENIFFFSRLQHELAGSATVLDVGCGNDSPLGRLNRTFRSEGIDIYSKCIEVSRQRHLHDTYKLGDVKKLSSYYKAQSFDTVVSIDVIEHLPKADALKMIGQMERIAKKKVILMTPLGYVTQGAYDGNPYQEHHSGWSKDDLQSLGYKVYGLRGLKYLRNDAATIKFSPWLFWGALSMLSEIILYPFPQLSFQLFAVKSVQPGAPRNKSGG